MVGGGITLRSNAGTYDRLVIISRRRSHRRRCAEHGGCAGRAAPSRTWCRCRLESPTTCRWP